MTDLRARVPTPSFALLGRVAFVAFVALVSLGCIRAEQQPASPLGVPPLPASRSVFFAPIGDFPIGDAEALVEHYREKFGMEIAILPPIDLPADAYNAGRRQVIAERVLDTVVASHRQAADRAAIVIALLEDDIYIASSTWRYAYGLRTKGHLAVVSTARLDDGLLADKTRRLQKLVTKDIGLLYFWLAQSDDPKSVLYKNVVGPMDLDRMSEDF